MPAPLIARGKTKLSPMEQAAAGILIGGPLAGLWYCDHHGRVIHFDNPWLNLGVHAALFIFPLTWVMLVYAKPVVYEAPPDNTVIAVPTFFSRWVLGWWTGILLWATPVVALVVLSHALFARDLAHPEILSTSLAKALGLLALIFFIGLFYRAMIAGREQPAIWISEEGLRTSIIRFYEWKDIHHMSRRGDLYELYSHTNPALPLCAFQTRDSEAQALLERHLAEHQIRMLNDSSPVLVTIKIATLLGFIGNIAFSLWLRFCLSLSFISVVLISFSIGIVLCVVLEKFRGILNFGQSRPVIELSHDDDDGDAPRPVV